MIKASELKDRVSDKNILPPNNPGIYKWLCDIDELKYLLNLIRQINSSGFPSNDEIISHIERNNNLYCIYVGKTDFSLRQRIKTQYVNGNAYGSTLRRTLYGVGYGRYNNHIEHIKTKKKNMRMK